MGWIVACRCACLERWNQPTAHGIGGADAVVGPANTLGRPAQRSGPFYLSCPSIYDGNDARRR